MHSFCITLLISFFIYFTYKIFFTPGIFLRHHVTPNDTTKVIISNPINLMILIPSYGLNFQYLNTNLTITDTTAAFFRTFYYIIE